MLSLAIIPSLFLLFFIYKKDKREKEPLKKLFGFNPETMTVKNEVIAGVTSFLAMAYILAVNPSMFSAIMPVESVFTATALAAIVGTLVMAFYAKMPFGLAPGMGLNAFFVFVVCLTMGHTWQFALTAVFIEGLIFILLTVTNLRNLIADSIPSSLKRASACAFRSESMRILMFVVFAIRPSPLYWHNILYTVCTKNAILCTKIFKKYLP